MTQGNLLFVNHRIIDVLSMIESMSQPTLHGRHYIIRMRVMTFRTLRKGR